MAAFDGIGEALGSSRLLNVFEGALESPPRRPGRRGERCRPPSRGPEESAQACRARTATGVREASLPRECVRVEAEV